MSPSALPVLPLPFAAQPLQTRARHMHLILPYAAMPSDSCQHVLQNLALPQLDQLLAMLDPAHAEEGTEDHPIPPHERAVARAWGLNPDAPAWAAVAQPEALPAPSAWMTLCHWSAGADQVRMDDPASLPITLEDAHALHAVLQPWFAEDGMQLQVVDPGRWLVTGAPLQDLPTASLDRVLLRDVSTWLPHSSHSRMLHRLHSEVQMLLYNHAFNAQRAQRGLPPINAFWLHGAGPLTPDSLQAAHTLQKVTPLLLVDSLRQAALRQDWPAWKAAWLAADAGPIGQVLAHVQLGGTATVTFCGERYARSYTSTRRNWLGKIKNKFSPQRFAGLHQAL